MEERWWTYDRAGRVRRIIDRWPGEDGETFQTTRLDYTGAGQLWLVRRFTTEYNLLGESWNEPVMQQIREFRYSGVGRARYWVLERDPETANHPVLSQSWHEYDGEEIAKDLDYVPGDPEEPGDPGSFLPAKRYVRGYGLVAALTCDAGDCAAGAGGSGLSNVEFFHGDMLGSTRLTTDGDGDALAAMAYSAFGRPLGSDVTGVSAVSSRYGWCGAWGYESDDIVTSSGDDDFRMVHVGARWYAPEIGRWLQRDPIGIAGGVNVFAYATNTPATLTDPTGTMDLSLASRAIVLNFQARIIQATTGAILTIHAGTQMILRNIDAIEVILTLIDPEAVYYDARYGNLSYYRDGVHVGVNDGPNPCIRTVTPRTTFPSPRFVPLYPRR